MDKWRWSAIQNEIDSDNLNSYWWHLREQLQGITPPEERTEEDFDAGSIYHIAADIEYTRCVKLAISRFHNFET